LSDIINKKENDMNEVVVEDKEGKKSDIGYVGRRLSKKEVKLMMVHAKSSEERAALVELMPKPQRRYG
jgi:hypothetical protein